MDPSTAVSAAPPAAAATIPIFSAADETQPSPSIYEPVSLPSTKLHPRPRKLRKTLDSSDSSTAIVSFDDPKPSPRHARNKTTSSATQVPRARSLVAEGEVEIAIRHLRNSDPHLARLIDLHHPPTFDSFQPPFLALTKSILYQQLAYKAGASIYGRFVALCGGEDGVVPEAVLAMTPQQLRQIGVSGRKASYLHDLARKYRDGILSDRKILSMDDKSLFTMLTMVNGIGSWSVHMFMIFSLYRPDVLPVNDLGIRKGVMLLYGLEELPRPSQMEQLCEKWRPYRSVASWYMWRFVEAKGSSSSAAAVANSGLSLQQQQEQQQQHELQVLQQEQQPTAAQFIDSMAGMMNMRCAWGQSM
ncbi:hypothetical protein Droror1_Dr00016665 [Drosera rotundifolia]